jgi:hypothetical protein
VDIFKNTAKKIKKLNEEIKFSDIQYNDKKIKEKKTNNDPEIIHISFYLRLRWYHTLQVKFDLLV